MPVVLFLVIFVIEGGIVGITTEDKSTSHATHDIPSPCTGRKKYMVHAHTDNHRADKGAGHRFLRGLIP